MARKPNFSKQRFNDITKTIDMSRQDYGKLKQQGMLPKKFQNDMGRFTGSVEMKYRRAYGNNPDFTGYEGRALKSVANFAKRENDSVWDGRLNPGRIANQKKAKRTGKPGRFLKN